MSIPVVLVLVSAVLHAAWNLLVKRHPDPNAAMPAVAALSGLTGFAFTAVELARGGAAFPDAHAVWLAVLCGVVETAYFLTLARALEAGSLGVAYVVVRGGGVLAVWPLAYLIHGECPTALQAGAIALMLGGLVLLVPPAGAGRGRAGFGWALVSAVTVAAYHVAYKAALSAGGLPWAVFAVAMVIAAPATVVGMGGARTPALSGGQLARAASAVRAAPGLLLAAGALSGLSFGLALTAMRTAGAAWVGTLRNASVALAPLLGWLFLGERPSARAAAGFAAVTLAVLLLAL